MHDLAAPHTPRRNLERKVRNADLAAARAALQAMGARHEGVQHQTDTYFQARAGRLKLREMEGQQAVLIWYDRPENAEVRTSAYYLVPVPDPALLRAALAGALGVRGEVRKQRDVWHWHNVRAHLDEVEGLGTFVEFEAVLAPGETEESSQERLKELSARLALQPGDTLRASYAELLGM
jgi:predicted adenylyl cyclase CyaB